MLPLSSTGSMARVRLSPTPAFIDAPGAVGRSAPIRPTRSHHRIITSTSWRKGLFGGVLWCSRTATLANTCLIPASEACLAGRLSCAKSLTLKPLLLAIMAALTQRLKWAGPELHDITAMGLDVIAHQL